jgi:hypothetical protein
MEKKIGTKVKNERLGVKGEIVGYCMYPSFIVTDENGKQWSGAIESPFYEEWEEEKSK